MVDYIPFNDFVPYAPHTLDEQTKINHTNCPAGEDTKSRLYVRKNKDGSIIAFCHNCQGKGVYKPSKHGGGEVYRNYRVTKQAEDFEERSYKQIRLPRDFTTELKEFPPEGLVWLYNNGITKTQVKDNLIGYSPSMRRIVFPVHDKYGQLCMWQARKIFDDDPLSPKYISSKGAKKDDGLYFCSRNDVTNIGSDSNERGGTLLLVEDMLSAIRCSKFVDSLALLGVSLSFTNYIWIIENYSRFIIMLDDDNPTVKRRQADLARSLTNSVGSSNVQVSHLSGVDPKEHSDTQLEEVMNEHLNKWRD